MTKEILELSNLKPVERTVEITNPRDENQNIGVRVTLMSLDDPRMKRIKRRLLDTRLQLESKGKHFKAAQIEDNNNDLVFDAMTGWEWYGDVAFRGEKPEFSRRNVLAVFEELPWFRDQLDIEIGDTKAFFAVSK